MLKTGIRAGAVSDVATLLFLVERAVVASCLITFVVVFRNRV